MPLVGTYTHRGVAVDFESTDVSLWDSGNDHKLELVCSDNLSVDKTLNLNTLTFWAGASGTYSSVEYASLIPTSATSNVTLVIKGKGTGGIQANVADGTSTGGNNRGTNAVDLQQSRSSASQVASGNYSFAAGGQDNTASGTGSHVSGISCTASGSASFAHGDTAVTSGINSYSLGKSTTADGGYSFAGGRDSHTQSRYGIRVFGSGKFSAAGDCQKCEMVLRGTSTSATPITLTSDAAAAGTTNQLVLRTGLVVRFCGFVVAHDDTNNQVGSYEIKGLIKREGAAASTSILASNVITEFENVSGIDVTLSADTTNGALSVAFTGAASKTYTVGCFLTWLEVI